MSNKIICIILEKKNQTKKSIVRNKARRLYSVLNEIIKSKLQWALNKIKLTECSPKKSTSSISPHSHRSLSISPDKASSLKFIINPLQLSIYKPNSIASYLSLDLKPEQCKHLSLYKINLCVRFVIKRYNLVETPKKKKMDPVAYRKRVHKGLKIISNVISRVVLSRRKAIWDILENTSSSWLEISRSSEISKRGVYDRIVKTEPSTEVEVQVFDKTDLDYYFMDRLEQMRDDGVKEDEYALIEREEQCKQYWYLSNIIFAV